MADPDFTRRVPPGDNRERLVCRSCGWVHYDNPKIVVGSVVRHDGGFLLCKRSIEPRAGYWTLPAGFLEENESTEDGARREAREEACVDLEIRRLLAVYSLPGISQVQLIYLAEPVTPSWAAGEETLEVDLFAWDGIPWEDIAFPTVRWALQQAREIEGRDDFPPFGNPVHGL